MQHIITNIPGSSRRILRVLDRAANQTATANEATRPQSGSYTAAENDSHTDSPPS